ncbi:MAG: zinc-binding dehydrogenase [Acidimicrobiales bacterium]
MRAAIMREGRIVVDDIEEPPLEAGQIRVRTLACGICGSDLHALHHADRMVEMSRYATGPDDPLQPHIMDPSRDVVMGHEFSAEVVELGAGAAHREGDIVVSMPIVMAPTGIHPVGYDNTFPGGYGEMMVLNDMMALDVPNGLDPRLAALTEPMAVGVHAVNISSIAAHHSAVVLGCGPVGLAVIAALRQRGVEHIVATDFSPTRRALAQHMGATTVVDPSSEPAVEAWRRVDGSRSLTIFEAVGVPGMLDQAMQDAPRQSSVVVVGVCMEPDTVRPMLGVVKELTIRFAFGYDPAEFAETLRHIAEGTFDVAPLITGSVDLDGVAGAFEALADPDTHAKILVEPATSSKEFSG